MSFFKNQEFISWCANLSTIGARVAAAVQLPNGKLFTVGDSSLGIRAFSKIENVKRRRSLDWVPLASLPPQPKELPSYVKEQKTVVGVAGRVIRHFMQPGQSYGEGDCFFWDHSVPVYLLRFSAPELKKRNFRQANVSLSDVISWQDFKIKSLGSKPKVEFKIKLSWRETLVLAIEIAYIIKREDPYRIDESEIEQLRETHSLDRGDNVSATPTSSTELVTGESSTSEPVTTKSSVINKLSEADISLVPIFMQMKKSGDTKLCKGKLVQILQIIPESKRIVVSDGDHWVEAELDKQYVKYLNDGINTLDILEIANCSGSISRRDFFLVRYYTIYIMKIFVSYPFLNMFVGCNTTLKFRLPMNGIIQLL